MGLQDKCGKDFREKGKTVRLRLDVQMLMYSHLVLEPGHGKSSWITLTIQVAAAILGHHVLVPALEFTKDQSNLLDAVASSNE